MASDYDIDDIYTSGGEKLTGKDLKGYDPVTLTISDLERVDFNDGTKIVLSFKETEKTFVLNKTNARRIKELTGESDARKWKGHQIILGHEMVEYNKGMVDGVRVQMPRTGKQAPLASSPF